MKKILTLVLLTFLSVVASAQLTYMRATSFTIAYKDVSSNQFVWNGTPSTCNILIELDDNDVVIYSKVKQHYHSLSKLTETEDGTLFRMIDDSGIICNLYIGPTKDYGSIYLAIEYNDYSWIYTGRLE